MQGVPKNIVLLLPHDTSWAAEYETARRQITAILADNVEAIYHIGSTAIPGIAAKPILDIAVVLGDMDSINASGMITAGYDDTGNRDVEGRRLFVMRRDGYISTHHIHCYPRDNDNLRRCLLFRDYLIAHPDAARAYNDLKLALCKQYADDRVTYTAQKADFIGAIIAMAER